MKIRLIRVLRIVWITAGLSFTIWLFVGFQALSVADEALESDENVVVAHTEHGIEFRPRSDAKSSGLLFLPGGIVEPIAYAPLLHKIASAGYPAHLINLPMRCACTDSQVEQLFSRVQQAMARDASRRWVLAGHSRGGMLAARFIHEKSTDLAGLALIGTTHPRDFSLSGLRVPIMKIYGTEDGVASYRAMRENQHLLPSTTRWVKIDGGNHVQFGHYRHQLGDGDAKISREEQQTLVEQALLEALSQAREDSVR